MAATTTPVSARLTDDEKTALTQSGLTVREIIRLGLDIARRQYAPNAPDSNPRPTSPVGNGDYSAQIAELSAQLADLRAQLAEVRAALDHEPTPARELDRQYDDRLRERAAHWHGTLTASIPAGQVVTITEATTALGVGSRNTARDRLNVLTAYGFADEMPRASTAPRAPRQWQIRP